MSTDAYLRTRLPALVATALLLALGAAACGADSEGETKADTTTERQQDDTAAQRQDGTTPRRGELVRSDGTVIHDWGDKRDNRQAVAVYRRMLDAFRAGDMARVCRNVDSFMLESFEPGRSKPDSPCETKMTEFASVLERRAPAKLQLLWVRSYGWVAGIWVEDARGKRFRIPFTTLYGGKPSDDERWRMELGSYPYPEMLNATLVDRG